MLEAKDELILHARHEREKFCRRAERDPRGTVITQHGRSAICASGGDAQTGILEQPSPRVVRQSQLTGLLGSNVEVRYHDDRHTGRTKYPGDLTKAGRNVGEVFQRSEGKHSIDGVVREGQMAAVTLKAGDTRNVFLAESERAGSKVESDRQARSTLQREMRGPSDAGTEVEDDRVLQGFELKECTPQARLACLDHVVDEVILAFVERAVELD